MKLTNNLVFRNLTYAFLAQGISLLSSFFIQFFCPKLLGVTEFSYWQLFLFYVSYINISRLGIIDGIYLKYGGKNREELNGKLLKTEFLIYSLWQILIAILLSYFSIQFIFDKNRIFVVLACALCLIIININNFLGFLFQAINETSIYSISEVIYNVLWFIAVLTLYFFKINSFKVIIYFYTLGQILAAVYLFEKSKFFLTKKPCNIRKAFFELLDDLVTGLPLLLAMYASMLITGCARMVIDLRWGLELFSYFSFAISLTTFILKFISQISMVIFPMIKRIDSFRQVNIYKVTNELLTLILPVSLIMLYPIKLIIGWWLPEYSTSLYYLGILFPICIFDGKMQLLYSTYFKAIREEKELLVINIISVFVCLVLSIFSAYIVNSLESVAFALLLSLAIRSLISEWSLNRYLNIKISHLLQITQLTIISSFVLLSISLNNTMVFYIYSGLYSLYLLLNYKTLKASLSSFKSFLGW